VIAAPAVAVGATAARSSAVFRPSSTAHGVWNCGCATDHRHGRENKWIIATTAHVDSNGLATTIIDLARRCQLGRPGLEQFRQINCLDMAPTLPAVTTVAVLHVSPADQEVAGVGGESNAEEKK